MRIKNIWTNAGFDEKTLFFTGLMTANAQDGFVARYNEDGVFKYAYQISGEGNDACNSIFIDDIGYMFIAGHFTGTTDFDASENTENRTSAGGADAFVAKYYYTNVGLIENTEVLKLSYYPNPVRDRLIISMENEYKDISINVYDNLGRIVDTYIYKNTNQTELDLSALDAGLYFVQIKADGINGNVKILKY